MKEKRILCIEVSGECKYFAPINSLYFECQRGLYCMKNPCAWKPITKDTCKNCKHAKYQGITRKQAIYKMAKALCNWYYHKCSECALKDKPKECRRFLKDSDFCEKAEAALNALLEENNGK